MQNILNTFYNFFNRDNFKISLFFSLIFLFILSVYVFRPEIGGDSVSYIQAIEIMKSGVIPGGFIPYRIITTFLGLRSIMAIDMFVNDLPASWLILNSLLYTAMGMFFYSLLLKIIGSSRTAFLGTLFLVTNYSAVVFGPHYLMDVGGWAFYVASLYFSFKYLETKEIKWLWLSAVIVGVGGLFKEYAFLAYVVILGLIVYTNWKQWSKMLRLIFFSGLLAFVPMVIINTYSFFIYDYTYLSWYSAQSVYTYQNRVVEYIKSFGSLYNFGWFLFIPGAYLLFKRFKETLKDQKLYFIWLTVLSSFPVFIWAAITQRILFISVPALILVSGIFLKKIDKWWYGTIPLLILYVLSSYLMDSYILRVVNIQSFLSPFF